MAFKNRKRLNKIYLSIFCFAFFGLYGIQDANAQVVVPEGNVTFVIASADEKTLTLTDREAAVKFYLESFGMKLTYLTPAQAAKADMSKARFIIATEKGVLDANTINSLITTGKGAILLYTAAFPLSDRWSDRSYYDLVIEKDKAFLEGYKSNLSFPIQVDGSAYFIHENYPLGWIAIGKNTGSDGYKTVFYRENESGGKGVIFTYDPRYFHGVGENMFVLLIEWVTNSLIPMHGGKIVPEGHIAFVISGSDDQTPILTDREARITDKLLAKGYNITYIRSSRLKASDLSKARFVIALGYPTINSQSINSLIEKGGKVILLYTSAGAIGGHWGVASGDNHIQVEKGEVFLKGYVPGISFHISKEGAYIDKGYPTDWVVLGRNTLNRDYKTTFYREHASGGRGVIFTYEPTGYSWRGESIFNALINWITNGPTPTAESVSEGNVIFVITNHDDKTILTKNEVALSEKLKSFGYKVSYVRFSRLAISDLSKAKFIIATEEPTLDANTINSLITTGKGVVLLYNAAFPLSDRWSDRSYYDLVIEKDKAFLEGYKSNLSFPIQVDGSAYFVHENYPLGWIAIGKNTGSDGYKTVFYRENESGGKGVIFTYNPQFYTKEGDDIFKKIAEWITPTIRPPDPPVLSSPTNEVTVESLMPTLQWQAPTRATSYSVQVAKDDKFTDTIVKQTDISKTTYTIPSGKLEDGKIYYWRVKAFNPTGESDWSSIQSFKVKIADKGATETMTTVKLKTPGELISKGSTFIVEVLVEKVTNLAGFEADLAFDPKLLEAMKVEEGDFLKHDKGDTNWLSPNIDKAKGLVSGIVNARTSPGGIDGSGTLAKVTFKAIGAGESPITLQNVILSNAVAEKIHHIAKSSTITIVDIPPILVKIDPSFQEVNKGKQFTVSIVAEEAKGLAGFQMEIKYNPAILKVIEVKEGDFLKQGGANTNWLPPTIDNKVGLIKKIVNVRAALGGVDGKGILSIATFEAVEEGETDITLQEVLLSDLNAKNIPSVTKDAKVKVKKGFPRWDVNQDGVVNIFDFVVVGQHFGEAPPTDIRADVNEDGTVSVFDFVLVGQHFGESYIPAAPSVWAMDYSQHLSALRQIYDLVVTNSNSSKEVVDLKRLLSRLILLAESQTIPSKSSLEQNYPNPFNPETWIPYQLAEESDVKIRVYNSAGRLVRTLPLGRKEPGIYLSKDRAAYWDGRNDSGEYVSSGVYFYELIAGDFRSLKKMVVVR